MWCLSERAAYHLAPAMRQGRQAGNPVVTTRPRHGPASGVKAGINSRQAPRHCVPVRFRKIGKPTGAGEGAPWYRPLKFPRLFTVVLLACGDPPSSLPSSSCRRSAVPSYGTLMHALSGNKMSRSTKGHASRRMPFLGRRRRAMRCKCMLMLGELLAIIVREGN